MEVNRYRQAYDSSYANLVISGVPPFLASRHFWRRHDENADASELSRLASRQLVPGAVCCALVNPKQIPLFLGTWCKAACDPNTEAKVCVKDADCGTGFCSNSSVGFGYCF